MQATDILKSYGLYGTSTRSEILSVLLDSKLALSMVEIRAVLKEKCDRITLYRNLKLFTNKGILHQVHVDGQASKYVLPNSIVEPKMIYEEHMHFKCMRCKQVKCLPQYTLDGVELPEGHKMLGANFVVFGICNLCNSN
jgi:Fur family ferric uptake transcriptional regulator